MAKTKPTPEEILQFKLQKRNCPPRNGIRMPHEVLQNFVTELFEVAGTRTEDAKVMSELLVQSDLRCVFSHGTGKVPGYLRGMLDGEINPCPNLKTVSESPGALVIDGDGGLGYLPCHYGTQQAILKAQKCGIAAVTTRHHNHFGAAGLYSRLAAAEGCIGMAMSAHRFALHDHHTIFKSVTDAPMSVAIPAGDQPPLVLDMGHVMPFSRSSYEKNPNPFFKVLGLSNVVHAMAGIFAGIYQPDVMQSNWAGNQGAFIAVIDIRHFMPADELKEEMDRYMQEARAMKPLPGLERAELPGGFEWQWEQDNRREGIPISPKHQKWLETIAGELNLESPFGAYEDTRF